MKGKYLVYFVATGVTSILLFFLACKKIESSISSEPLVVNNYFPNSGKEGTLVTINGSGLGRDITGISVNLAGKQAEVISATGEKVVFRVPNVDGSGMIVISKDGENIVVGEFLYQELSVHNVLPDRAQVGSQVKVIGEGFSSVSNPVKVFVNGTEAHILSALEREITIEVPSGTGIGSVTVEADGKTSEGPLFYFMNINEVKPMTGGAGTRVVIDGEGFSDQVGENVVSFNGKQAEILEVSNERLVARVPLDVQTGQIQVMVGEETLLGPDFTVVPAPEITSVSPLSGPSGSEMVISGRNYSPLEGETKVSINGIDIEPSDVSNSEIRLVVPSGIGYGKVVVNVNDQVTEGPYFREQNLGIKSLSPDNGMEGTQVTISGTGFNSDPNQNQVLFNGIPADILSASPTAITVDVPANVSTGKLTVMADGMTAESAVEFRRAGVVTVNMGSITIPTNGGSVAVDAQGNAYVLLTNAHRIVKISADGQVSHFAGSTTGATGNVNGIGAAARFNLTAASSLAISPQGDIYLTDGGNRSLRKITQGGQVSTVISSFGNTSSPGRIAMHPSGTMFISTASPTVYRVNSGSASFSTVLGINGSPNPVDALFRPAVDDAYNYYGRSIFSLSMPHTITMFSVPPSGTGAYGMNAFWIGFMSAGYADGAYTDALFNTPKGMLMNPDRQSAYIWDGNNYALRSVKLADAMVSTVFKASNGTQDGDFRTARFSANIVDMALSPDGSTLYVLDGTNGAVRKIYLR